MDARYDEDHRGPAVPDALGLGECLRLLLALPVDWPKPDTAKGKSILSVIRSTYPAEQIESAVREFCRSEGAVDLLRDAILKGDLSLWVSPTDGTERPVDRSALLEFDRQSIVAGVYRPPNDRGWLFGRPLFVKRAEWEKWICSLDSSRRKPSRGRGRPKGAGSLAAEDEPLVHEMRHLRLSGQASSWKKAAEMVAHKAPGASFDSTVRRLLARRKESEK